MIVSTRQREGVASVVKRFHAGRFLNTAGRPAVGAIGRKHNAAIGVGDAGGRSVVPTGDGTGQ